MNSEPHMQHQPPTPEIICDGLGFPEGPVALADGSVLLMEIEHGTVSRVSPDGRRSIVKEVGGGPNGAAIGPDGALYICNNGGMAFALVDGLKIPQGPSADHTHGWVQRLDLDSGELTVVVESAGGQPLIAPNDLVFDKSGGFWFTDHGSRTEHGMRFGALCYMPSRAGGCDAIRVRDGLMSPNGVGLSPDGLTLYVADTWTGRLLSFEVAGPGRVAEPPPFHPGNIVATLPGFQLLDSLAVEADGHVCVGTLVNGGITIFSPSGDTEHVALPDMLVTNLCFGGPDMQDVWLTCSGSGTLRKARWSRPGLPLAFGR
ncbi:SMP-30/gluconolactonase/LRE family protein [Sphingopyxis sp. Root1497]|uniref:SMP-30/gluconolactonase/LRE family protein n=1 Tax=Sphingopyxis sp. Root1497 TaxID=1736474 RepID=UPI001F1BDDA0|nr:SMP-30/gluconolactonase/LRE family protein [Sphingopyxis sp. Root1497]